jgi:uncharacterized protein (DUF433 family)
VSPKARKAKKGEPFSVRLSGSTDAFVAAEARRTRRSKSSIVEELTEEAARMRRFPGIGFRTNSPGTRDAWVIGTGLDVWELTELLRSYGSPEAVVQSFPLVTQRHVQLAQAYRETFPEEIDEAMAENDRTIEERLELYPLVELRTLEA